VTGRVRSVAAAVRRGSLGFCTSASGHSRDRRVRSGARGTTNAKDRSDAVARHQTRPVMIDRTRPVVCGCLLESTGRWHCGVRSVQTARPVTLARERVHLSDRYDRTNEIQSETHGVHRGGRGGAIGRVARPVKPDQHVRSPRVWLFHESTTLFFWGFL
jgi:hypothetical protein